MQYRRFTSFIVLACLAFAGCTHTVKQSPARAGAGSLSVMSFNIQHDRDWDRRKGLVVADVQQASPDIIGLQEALIWQLEFLTDEIPEYAWFAAGRDDGRRGGETTGILFNKARFDLAGSGMFWFSDSPATPGSVPGDDWGNPTLPRMATWVRLLDSSSGRGFYVFNVHLQHDAGTDPGLARFASVQLLLDRISDREHDEPVVVTGDFNATKTEAPIRALTSIGPVRYCPQSGLAECRRTTNAEPFVDAYRVAERSIDAGTRCFDGDDRGRRIDYVFVSPEITVARFKIGDKHTGECASDHRFVLAEITP